MSQRQQRLFKGEAAGVRAIEDAFARAEFVTLRTLLEAVTPHTRAEGARVDVVRARLARIEGDLETCCDAAKRAAAQHPDAAQRLFARTLQALALSSCEPENPAALTELRAVERAVRTINPVEAAFSVYLLALDAWQRRDYLGCEALLARNYQAGARLAETHNVSGWIDVKRERYASAGAHFDAALAALEASGTVDERLRARLVHGIANVAAETIDLELGTRARAAFEKSSWTDALAVEHFNTLTMLRYLALLEGDFDRAWLLARRAATLMNEGPYAVHGETGAAFVSDVLGDHRAANIQLRRAWQLLRTHRWSDADHEERVALTDFAMVAARSMPAEARQAITLYRSLEPTANPRNALEGDRRVTAFELWASARVTEALGERHAALAQYQTSLDMWRELGHDLRVGEVAADLYRLTSDATYARTLRALLRAVPNAWFGRVLRMPSSPVERLTTAQRRVLDELLQGKSAKTIADELGRSHHTVSNHTRKIFEAFGVKSRARLLARCAQLGITATKDGGPGRRAPARTVKAHKAGNLL